MPRYAKKFKLEMAFFINPKTGYVTYNKKCKACLWDCKQSYRAEIVACPHYLKKEGVKLQRTFIAASDFSDVCTALYYHRKIYQPTI